MGIKVGGIKDAEAWKGSAILGPGRHEVLIETADETQSSGGYDQVELQFVAVDGSGDIRDWLTFSDKTPEAWTASLGRAKSLLEACGVETGDNDEFPTAQLPGKRLSITVVKEPKYSDPSKMVSKVKAYNPPSGNAPTGIGFEPADDDEIPF